MDTTDNDTATSVDRSTRQPAVARAAGTHGKSEGAMPSGLTSAFTSTGSVENDEVAARPSSFGAASQPLSAYDPVLNGETRRLRSSASESSSSRSVGSSPLKAQDSGFQTSKLQWNTTTFPSATLLAATDMSTAAASQVSLETSPGTGSSLKMRRTRRSRVARAKVMTSFASNHRLEDRLRQAASDGDFDKVKLCLEKNADTDAPDDKQRRALHFASAGGHESVVQLLLDHGADPNVRDRNGNTPLHLAACTNSTRIITLLLHHGTDPNSPDYHGRTPLRIALSHLKLLQKWHSQSYSVGEYKGKVTEIVRLLKEYFSKTGSGDDAALDRITSQLSRISTREDADEFQSLLEEFTCLSIERAERIRPKSAP